MVKKCLRVKITEQPKILRVKRNLALPFDTALIQFFFKTYHLDFFAFALVVIILNKYKDTDSLYTETCQVAKV